MGQRRNYDYQRHKGDRCAACGFEPEHPCQLDVDHVDGNRENSDPSNLQTLCANCHRLKSQRDVVDNLASMKARGERTGGVPYGSQLGPDGRTLEPNPAEQAVLARLRELRASGVTLQAITNQLNADGTPPRGSRWHLTTVARLLTAE